MYMTDESHEKWNSTSYKISERYDSEAKWMAFLSFLDVLPKDSRVFAHLIEFRSSAWCSRISVRQCGNQASQYRVQYPTHMPEWRKTDDVATRTGILFDHHSLEKTVSEFISQKEGNVPVSSSYTPQMRSFSSSWSVSSHNHFPSNSIVRWWVYPSDTLLWPSIFDFLSFSIHHRSSNIYHTDATFSNLRAITTDDTLYPSHHWSGTMSETSHMTYGPHRYIFLS